jgi:AraC-like DNA-binding protein
MGVVVVMGVADTRPFVLSSANEPRRRGVQPPAPARPRRDGPDARAAARRPPLARIAHVSEAHFIRTFGATFGETPHRYLQRRRVERAMFLLRETERSVTEICLDVGFASLGTFSRTFARSSASRRAPTARAPTSRPLRRA